MMLPLYSKENMVERKVAITSVIASTSSSSSVASATSQTSSRSPLLASASSKAKSSMSCPSRLHVVLVTTATCFLWVLFRLIDCYLSIFSFVWKIATTNRRRRILGRTTKTVVIVGGNFAGLSALWQLLAWQRKHHFKDIRIVLIDQREYSEYTPGILRLFCEPGLFWHLAQSLPGATDAGCGFERIQGIVTSIVGDDSMGSIGNATSQTQRPNKLLTYIPVTGGGGNDNNNTADSLQVSASTKNLDYDYLILATGATYSDPISPATAKVTRRPTTSKGTLNERYQEWQKAHERLKVSRSVLILGGGAVGVELAAEILDHDKDFTKTVTVVDAQPTLAPLFPSSVGSYAEAWLSRKGAILRLGESLRSWNDRSCTMADGTILHADVVYVCFGNRPNSEMVAMALDNTEVAASRDESKSQSSSSESNTLFSLTRRRNVVVKDTLQLVFNNDTNGENSKLSDACWFACGDVASPPTNDEKQAFQAEMQGKLAARNVIAMLEASRMTNQQEPTLFRYPEDIAGSDRIPLVFVLSLGRYDGVLGFNSLCILGPLAAIVKWILEYTKVSQMRGQLLGHFVWKIGDVITLFLSRTLIKSSLPPPATETSAKRASGSSIDTSRAIKALSSPPLVRQTVAAQQRHQYRQLEEQLKIS